MIPISIKKIFYTILFLILILISSYTYKTQASFFQTYDLHIHGSYFGTGGDSSLRGGLGLKSSILHNPSNLGGQITVSANSIQIGFRQFFQNPDYFYGGPRLFDLFEKNVLYLEPAFSHRRYSNKNINSFGGYLGILISERIGIDLSLGLEFWPETKNEESKRK